VVASRRILACCFAVFVALVVPSTAFGDTTINFDDLAPGTVVTNQYADVGGQGQGVVFGPLPAGAGSGHDPVIASAPGQAASGSQVGDISQCAGCEFPPPVTTGTFGVLRSQVSVKVGYLGTHSICQFTNPDSQACAFVTLTAYDSNGHQVGTPATGRVTMGGGVTAPLTVSTSGPQILGFKIAAREDKDRGKQIVIDDLSFDVPAAPPAPDFVLFPQSTNVTIVNEQSVDDPIGIARLGGSSGDIQFSVSGLLPAGVSAQIVPNPVSGDGTTLTFNAVPDAEPSAANVTITATPLAPSAGTATHQFVVHVGVNRTFDPEVLSMQITQGTQTPILPARDPSHFTAPVRYESIEPYSQAGTQEALARLSYSKTTVVRVYADLLYGPAAGIAVPAVLRGWRYTKTGQLVALGGSPISPAHTGGVLIPNLKQVVPDLNTATIGVYTFVLPSAWTRGQIKLQAELLTSQIGSSGPVVSAKAAGSGALNQPSNWAPCLTGACQTNDKFAISEIPFLFTHPVTVRPLALNPPGEGALPDPEIVFQWARLVSPMELMVEPYATTIDIGDVTKTPALSNTREVLDRVRHYVCNHGEPAAGWDVGVESALNLRTAEAAATCYEFPAGASSHNLAFVDASFPFGSVAHEVFHLYGRPHASFVCGGGANGQPAELWPTDQFGYIQSVGLAPSLPGASAPYQVIDGLPPEASPVQCRTGEAPANTCDGTQPHDFFDFMSYCAPQEMGDPRFHSDWISVHNWNAVLANFGFTGSARAGFSRPPVHASRRAIPSLAVTANVDQSGKVEISSVEPVQAPPAAAGGGNYHLTATGAGGHALADVPMEVSHGHADGLPSLPVVTLSGVVPANGAQSVQIAGNGSILAARAGSAHAPVAKLGLPRFRRDSVLIKWTARDADRDALVADVQYSGDNGKSWRSIWIGGNRGQAVVPKRYLFRSARARLAVVVNDGFRATKAVSPRFRSPGAAPSVRILLPSPGLSQPADAPLSLEGQAFDDRLRVIGGHRLRWMLGPRLLGRGAKVTVTGLPAGKPRIDLIATDTSGRTAKSSVRVNVRAVRPLFLILHAPRRASSKARSIKLGVASSLPAKLIAGTAGRRSQLFAVDRRLRTLKIAISPGRRTLTVKLKLQSGSLARTAVVTLARR
jgi:hypothetical protein